MHQNMKSYTEKTSFHLKIFGNQNAKEKKTIHYCFFILKLYANVGFFLSLCPMPPYQRVHTNSPIFLISDWINTYDVTKSFSFIRKIFHHKIIKLRDIFSERVNLIVSCMRVSKSSWTGFS